MLCNTFSIIKPLKPYNLLVRLQTSGYLDTIQQCRTDNDFLIFKFGPPSVSSKGVCAVLYLCESLILMTCKTNFHKRES